MQKVKKLLLLIALIFAFCVSSNNLSNINTSSNTSDFADYNELYGIEKREEPIIAYNTKASKQNLKNIAVFIKFSDSATNITHHIDDLDSVNNALKLFNSDDLIEMDSIKGIIKVPSFKKYYEMQSYGQLSITTEIFPKQNGQVIAYQDSKPMSYYQKYSASNPNGYKNADEELQRETELINNAVLYVSNQVATSGITPEEIDSTNDGIIDAISFYIEGKDSLDANIAWGDLLWSHKLDNYNITNKILGKSVIAYNLIYAYDYSGAAGLFSLNRGTYGTIIHEFGHTLGYSDLYRFDNSAARPVGFFDIMGNTVGSNPQDFLTYFISNYNPATNWHSPLPVIDKTTDNITLYKPEYQNPDEKRAVKIVTNKNSLEYFVIEYHEKKNTYDTYSADASGIIVYRVNDKNKYNGNKDGGLHGENDHVFVFRPNEPNLGAGLGELSKATLNLDRPLLGKNIGVQNNLFDNKTIYYANGTNSGIIIEVTATTNNSVTFNLKFPEINGSGTEQDPYLISTPEMFLYLMGLDTKGKFYKLVNDLDFKSIVNYPAIDFMGNLDGQDHTISNVTTLDSGLFGMIGIYDKRTTIKNLVLDNITVKPKSGNHLGGFASNAMNVAIDNVHIKNSQVENVASAYNDAASTGGFIGYVANDVIVENCTAKVSVKGVKNIGGFIGMNGNANLKNIYVDSSVSGNSNVGTVIGIQSISDATYNVPQNVYYNFEQKGAIVGGYYKYQHNTSVLPTNQLDKNIYSFSVPQSLTVGETPIQYVINTNSNGTLPVQIISANENILKYTNNLLYGISSGTTKLTVTLNLGKLSLPFNTDVTVSVTTPPIIPEPSITESEVLNYLGLTKKDGYVVGFSLGTDVSSIRNKINSYQGLTLLSFKNGNGSEINSGIVATGMNISLYFNNTTYNYTIVIKADVNGDGYVYATDYVKIKNHIMGKSTLTGPYLLAADVNNDGFIYATDYVKIKNYIMGRGTIEQVI